MLRICRWNSPCGRQNQPPIIFGAHDVGPGAAYFFEAGKIPEIWKIPALLRLHRLHGAVISLEKNTGAIRLLLQRQALPVTAQSREALDELELAQMKESSHPRDRGIVHAHLPGPTTARGATLALVEDRHGPKLPGGAGDASTTAG